MKRTRRTFLAIIGLTAAGVIAIFASNKQGLIGPGSLNVTSILVTESVQVSIASAVTKNRWLEAAAAKFESQNVKTKSGKPIDIEIQSVLSGTSMQHILDGKLQPVVWSPGEESWTAQFNDRWAERTQSRGHEPAMQADHLHAEWAGDVATDGRGSRVAEQKDRLEDPHRSCR